MFQVCSFNRRAIVVQSSSSSWMRPGWSVTYMPSSTGRGMWMSSEDAYHGAGEWLASSAATSAATARASSNTHRSKSVVFDAAFNALGSDFFNRVPYCHRRTCVRQGAVVRSKRFILPTLAWRNIGSPSSKR
mmetsp:Transcript_2815/g.9462  ORF Transcript_2815/g.9462 Transcript_2815/m.9462 type:complete len:132 (+) Transcript_2815:520-915(+)